MTRVIPTIVQHRFRSRADHCLPEIQRGSGHPRRAGAPEGTADVEGTGVGHGLCFVVRCEACCTWMTAA